MRALTILLSFVFIVTACNKSPQSKHIENEESHDIEVAAENLSTIDFEVHGMTCTGCEKAITSSIDKLEGIQSVTASHIDSNTVVSFDKLKTDPEKIKEAIQSAGYVVAAYVEVSTEE
ncbi:MAG: heavy-metal-associated domain-containing protein [Bacteroidales bacterium]|nr:heavy-metal-associated domain-containing protein [Bacteroidales bacterium]